jgi:hypothetical protein
VLELRAREATSGAVRGLLELAPRTAIRVRDGGDEEIAIDAIAVGERLRVRPGREGAGRRQRQRRQRRRSTNRPSPASRCRS